jgi:hypothetical protein
MADRRLIRPTILDPEYFRGMSMICTLFSIRIISMSCSVLSPLSFEIRVDAEGTCVGLDRILVSV